MNDIRSIVDDIQSVIYSLAAPDEAVVRHLAAAYDTLCRAANERLRRCEQMLEAGLRNEAIQLCEMSPNLLDMVGGLDFPEGPQWREMLGSLGIPGPPLLMTNVAADVNEAYAIDRPLSSLSRMHRLFAVARGPLEARIEVLRKIAEMDGNNEVWENDLREYEQVRLEQMGSETRQARKNGDLDALTLLAQETKAPCASRLRPPLSIRSAKDAGRSSASVPEASLKSWPSG